MCLPSRVAFEKAEHKKFSVQGFWDEHFGEGDDDESSDDESSDGERSDEGRLSHEAGTDHDEDSDDEGSDDEASDDESSDGERSDRGRPSHEAGTEPEDDTASKKSLEEDPPLDLNYDALKHVANNFLPGSHGACTDITTLECGYFYEERLLHFEDGWTCFGLFARDPKDKIMEQVESSLATMEYVRAHTTIPVPQIYFVNHDENHVVGSAFIPMERMPGTGETLYDVWDELSREQKIGLYRMSETRWHCGPLAKCFPCGSADREHVKQSFREKNYAFNKLHDIFMYHTAMPQYEESIVGDYLKGLRGENNGYFTRAYGGVWDWQPDSEPESDTE